MSDLIERLRLPPKDREFRWRIILTADYAKVADLIEAQQAEIAQLRGLLGKVFSELDTTQSPGHHHSIAGVWDDYNGELSGKPCEWCATWSEVRQELEQK